MSAQNRPPSGAAANHAAAPVGTAPASKTGTADAHPDFQITADIIAMLAGTRDAQGRAWDIVEVPAPDTLHDEFGWVDYSYINHLVVNGGVIACSFDDPADAGARRILEQAYPGREVVTVDARPIFARGGGIHCITQHQPAV